MKQIKTLTPEESALWDEPGPVGFKLRQQVLLQAMSMPDGDVLEIQYSDGVVACTLDMHYCLS